MPQAPKYTLPSLVFYIFTLPLPIVIGLGAGGCTTNPALKMKAIDSVSTPVDKPASQVLWPTPENMTPLEFLQTMRRGDSSKSIGFVTISDSFPKNWIKEKDVDTLVKLVNSREKCLCILNPLSSYIPNDSDSADLGGYAFQLIQSYKQKKKLTFGLYACPKTNKIEADKLVDWWQRKH